MSKEGCLNDVMSHMVPGSLRRSQRVGPISHGTDANNFMVELRKSRRLHILHLNPRPRDPRFQQEMTLYLQYRKSGPGMTGGPLIMPRRQTHPKQQVGQQITDTTESAHPQAVNSEKKPESRAGEVTFTHAELQPGAGVIPQAPEMEADIYEGPSGASSLFSSPAHAAPTGNTRSASSVLLALHNQGRPTQATGQLPQVNDGDETDLKLALSPKSEGPAKEEDLPAQLSPLSPETQNNGASTCPDLFTPRQEQTTLSTADVTSPKSMPAPTHASSFHAPAPADTDLVIFSYMVWEVHLMFGEDRLNTLLNWVMR